MMKKIKRGVMLTLMLMLLVIPFTKINFNKNGGSTYLPPLNNDATPVFSNKFFDTDLNSLYSEEEDGEYVTMTGIYNAMLPFFGSNLNINNDLILKNILVNLVDDRPVSISNDDELFYFGNAQSINFNEQASTNRVYYEETIKYLLSLDYELLNDIDYSKKRALKFVPLGTLIDLGDEETYIDFPFTGSFNGNGFKIHSLYFADINYVSTTFQDSGESSAITVTNFQQYAMFANVGEDAVIKNFILNNPRYEILMMDGSMGLVGAATIAGLNKGTIYNVGVIDEKKVGQDDNSGIAFDIIYPSTETYNAAGLVYENHGELLNSFFVGKEIIKSSSQFRFYSVDPVVYINEGTVTGIVYGDNTEVKFPVNESLGVSESLSNIKSGGGSVSATLELGSSSNMPLGEKYKWYYYEADGYPLLFGLDYEDNAYSINDASDLLIFSILINLNTVVNGKQFDSHTYYLKNDIDMASYKTFKTIGREFKGKFIGGETDFTHDNSQANNNKYIHNLNISNPHVKGSEYYLGLFSVVSGEFRNVNFSNAKLLATDTQLHFGKETYIGTIAGKSSGTIKNVIVDSNIDLGTRVIGRSYVGGLVGYASGDISYSANLGHIDGNVHDFEGRTIIPNFYVGGIVGSNDSNKKLSLTNVINEGLVTGVGSSINNYESETPLYTYTGGIIGEVNNTNNDTVRLFYVTNNAPIDAGSLIGKQNDTQFVGGVFGSLRNKGFKLNDGLDVYSGRFENTSLGLIKGSYVNANTKLMAAGIGVINTTESLANVSYMSNDSSINNDSNGFNINGFNYITHNDNIYYASTVVDNSTGGIILSRAYNSGNNTIHKSYFDDTIAKPNKEIELALFHTSATNEYSKLLYVENSGSLTVGNTTENIGINQKLKISNITQATRIDYKNVINSGDVVVLRIGNTNLTSTKDASNSIYVAGITWILPYDNRAYTMENSSNEGNIITAGITSNTIYSNISGQSFSNTTFSSTINSKNLYVAGLVNINVGEITNSFNLGDITSTYSETVYNIKGTANTFVGGINTFNYNLIKDVANSGLINYTNDNSTSNSQSKYVASENISGSNNSTFGGVTIAYTGGVVAAGITAALGDISGTELNGHKSGANSVVANVIDTINNGDIFAKSRQYVRAGGILGVALSVELASGTFDNKNSGIQAGPFTTVTIGSGDPVGQSLLSNGLNYGNVYAVTMYVGNYGTTFGTGIGNTDANAIRPGINAVSGGVIGYGLTKMVRMINHGVISSTDAAGGIVGATYILGRGEREADLITEVEIDTAVHYGKVKAIKIGSYNSSSVFETNNTSYNNFKYIESDNFNSYTRFYQTNEYGDYIYYRGDTNNNYIESFQQARRGFGGVFGRLQRGNYGTMKALGFKNVMNMDPDIDFVGRVDSNTVGSLVYYRFFTGEETYYSIRENDKSPNAFVGWNIREFDSYNLINASIEYTISGTGGWFSPAYVSNLRVINNTNTEVSRYNERVLMEVGRTSVNTHNILLDSRVEQNFSGYIIQNNTSSSTEFRPGTLGLSNTSAGTYTQNFTGTIDKNLISSGNTSTAPTVEGLRYPVRKISETNDGNGDFIFDPSFPLMSPENSEYIYAVESDALADRFNPESGIATNPKPNGMYVLASSSGSQDGQTLPTNININNLLSLEEENVKYIDLENVNIDDKKENNNLISKYQKMYQLSYNDKSLILDETDPGIADLILYDPYGNSPTLRGGVIDGNEITFTINKDAFLSSGDYYYEVESAILSHNAFIAKNELVGSSVNYSSALGAYIDRDDFVVRDEEFKWSTTGNNTGNLEFQFNVYSEIFISDENIFNANKYYDTYTIYVIKETDPFIVNARIDVDGVTKNIGSINTNLDYGLDDVDASGSIEAIFYGDGNYNDHIPKYHNITIHGLFYDNNSEFIEVEDNFYNLDLFEKGSLSNPNEFGFKMNLSDKLRSGNYYIEYSIYNSSTKLKLSFAKKESTLYGITYLDYVDFSLDEEGLITQIPNTITEDFTSYMSFGHVFPQIKFKEYSAINFQKVFINDAKPYANDVDYYSMFTNLGHIGYVRLPEFAELLVVSGEYDFDHKGRRIYTITYTLRSEANDSEGAIKIVQTIIERPLDPLRVYLDDNLQLSTKFNITREAIISKIDVNFNFLDNSFYSMVDFSILEDIDDISNKISRDETSEDTFRILVTDKLETGPITYIFILTREGYEYELGEIIVTKLMGNSAHLIDVKFTVSDDDFILEYPSINAINNLGQVTDYQTRMFFDGIDYDNSDLDSNITNFNIDGKVTDIILDNYMPRFTLPPGAKIARVHNGNPLTYYTAEEIAAEEALELYGDFESHDDELTVVTYRVESEDGNNTIDYNLTVIDVRYVLSLRFTIYFETSTGSLVEAHESPLVASKVLLITLKNLKVDDGFHTTNEKVSGFPELGTGDIEGVNNQSQLYYFTNGDPLVQYRFGRNLTGAYVFNVLTPKFQGVETEELKPGVRFHYDMYIKPRGEDDSIWFNEDYMLPSMNLDGYKGRYYFITSTSQNPITREIAIVIRNSTQNNWWGIYDDYTSFD